MAPNTVFLHVHHWRRRADGGDHDPAGLILLCSLHHRRVHDGFLIIDGSPETGWRFLHADGTAYGGAVDPQAVEAFGEAFTALRKLGFRESDVRAALNAIRTHVGESPTTERVVREALARLRAAARSGKAGVRRAA